MSSGGRKGRGAADDIGRAARAAAILGAIFTVGAFALSGSRAGFSVILGAAIAIANLLTMRAIIVALMTFPEDEPEADAPKKTASDHAGAGKRGGVAWGLFAVLKIVVLFGGVWILLTRHLVDPMPLVLGYGVLPLGIAASALVSSLRPR